MFSVDGTVDDEETSGEVCYVLLVSINTVAYIHSLSCA